ncbi:protein tyrosine phosphatase [Emericellopsis atlantica]|uniref:Very-long-chain (3R)-3-hydroxyacyl-CoA dehydratase n=1 Tax=Emericellopsis atlantica TaxID=2614577 RepID=A0A9P7ZKN0_9HYPO|nr:protein tyrosine phosphatase [Emericellopsis atlantica]KAG9253340.1 protein tyrosine phosphatase [Emericellopsis atlantica]
MARPSNPQRKPASALKTNYLVLYNVVSAFAWSVVLSSTVKAVTTRGPTHVLAEVGEWTKWTQTAAALEILHSLLGIVRAPVFTTIMQVSSRLLLVWGIVHPFPHVALDPFYASMLLAWSLTEVIRYSFFAVTLSVGNDAFYPITWLRYNTFFVLYPVGITSECMLIYKAMEPATKAYGPAAYYALAGVLAVYVPGSYILFTYMMKQRSKVMRGLKQKDGKATQ